MWDWCPEILPGNPVTVAQSYCARLAAPTGLDGTAIWEWGFIERVSIGLYLFDLAHELLARPFLKTADLLA